MAGGKLDDQLNGELYDVVVVGGGAAGIAAACGAARAGARVLALERYGFLGGAATNASVLTYCGFFARDPAATPVVGGVGASVLRRIAALGGDVAPVRSRSGNWIVLFDPEAVKRALDDEIAASGADLWLHARVTDAWRTGNGGIEAVRVTDHAGTRTVRARSVVDASGEASLAALAGVPANRDAGAVPQAASLPIRLGGLPHPVGADDRPAFARAAQRANAVLNERPVRDDGGVIMALPGGEAWWMCIDVVTDGLSAESLSGAERLARRAAWACLDGLRAEPGYECARLIATGPQLGIRESRRVQSRRNLTEDAAREGRRDPDGVARAAWPMEVHEAPGKPKFEPIGGAGFFDVWLDALRAAAVDNLWLAGRVVGADDAAYGSVRVMGTAFATGHAAGVAAALQASTNTVDPTAIRRILAQQDAII